MRPITSYAILATSNFGTSGYTDTIDCRRLLHYSVILGVTATEPSSAAFSNALTSVSLTNNTIYASGHGLSTGTPLNFTTDGTLPSPLVTGTVYYAISASNTTVQVATSYVEAIGGTALSLTGVQSYPHYYTVKTATWADAAISAAASTISISGDDVFEPTSGCKVQVYGSTAGYPAGLSADTDYYVASISSGCIALATSYLNAVTDPGVYITLSAATVGGTYYFQNQVIFGDEAVSAAASTISATAGAHGLTANVSGYLSTSGTLPTGFATGTVYYPAVASSTATVFTLAAATGGDPIEITALALEDTHVIDPIAVSAASSRIDVSHDGSNWVPLVGQTQVAVSGTQYYMHKDSNITYPFSRIMIGSAGGNIAMSATLYGYGEE